MGLSLGLVGLPNSGKTTLFNALAKASAHVAAYPFTTIEPNVGVVPVPDGRLTAIAAIVRPERAVPTTVEFVDIAGLVKGASQGEGLGNQFLGHIRNVDAVVFVLRGFADEDIAHVYGSVDPARDAETIALELALADLATLDRRIERIRTAARTGDKRLQHELPILESLRSVLEAGGPARRMAVSPTDSSLVGGLGLLTGKPLLYVLNLAESDLSALRSGEGSIPASRWLEMVRGLAAENQTTAVLVGAQLECDLSELAEAEAAEYLQAIGLPERGLTRLVEASYRLLDLITFFTTTGGKEVRAWTVTRGTRLPQAAGKVHSDMERGFIRADVVSFGDLQKTGSLHEARERGLLRTEGREYLVQDGDIVHVRFNI